MPELSENRLTAFQIGALLCCILLNVQDGFDILSIAFSANAISNEWNLSATMLGAILSASLFGIMLGATLLGPHADKIGRKPMTIIGLIISGIGMLGAATAINSETLLISRCITGIGIGGILASLNTLVAEYAGERYRSTAVALFQMGFPLGAIVGGFVAGWILDIGGWRQVFVFGAVLSFLFIPLIMLLPESVEYLAKSGKANSLKEINRINRRLGKSEWLCLPPQQNAVKLRLSENIKILFSRYYRLRTCLIWLAFFFLQISLYFALSWVPKLLIGQGMSEQVGIRGGIALNMLGVLGIASFAILSMRFKATRLALIYLLGGSLILLYLGSHKLESFDLFTNLAVVALIGFFLHASMIALYAIIPSLYPVEIRATGTGWAIGLSRLGAVLGPWLTGALLAKGWQPEAIYPLFALPTLLSAAAIWLLARSLSQKSISYDEH